MQAKTERFEMRLDPQTLNEVDEWRSLQDGIPSRSEAIRRLIEIGLARGSSQPFFASNGEKLVLHMLCDIAKHLKIDGGVDPSFVEDALVGGHLWGLEWQYTGIFHGYEDQRHVLRTTVNVLDMWDFLESGYEKLTKKDKAKIEEELGPSGKDVRFFGFSGNEEAEFIGVARFLVDSMQRFTRFKDRDMDSHMPSIESYLRMYRAFEPIRATIIGGQLNADQIVTILKERIHPSKRN